MCIYQDNIHWKGKKERKKDQLNLKILFDKDLNTDYNILNKTAGG